MPDLAENSVLHYLQRVWSLEQAPAALSNGLAGAKEMHQLPLDYYVARIRNLGLRGKSVLDAGCGTGTWSFALRAAFDEVIGLDYTEDRIRVAKWLAEEGRVPGVEFRVANVLDTGLPEASVDAVFCYSVLISSVSVEDALKEFHRVLKPGGVAYVSLNGIGWSYYLRDERGKEDVKYAEMGRQGIYNTLVRQLPDHEINAIYHFHGRQFHRSGEPARKTFRVIPRPLHPTLAQARSRLHRWIRHLSPVGMPQCRLEQVAETILEECGEAYYVQLAVDIAPMADGNMTVFSHATASRGYTPDELQAVCESVGLIDFQWATEGMITGATMPDPPKPIYQGYVGQHLKVWEFLAFKPDDTLTERIEPDWFRNNTRDAARLPYLAMARMPILTNVDAATVPRGWVQEAQRRARAAGGERLIDSLANKLCAGIENDEGRIEAIVRFVQDVLIHHPLVQPLEFNGAAVTDPATLLFLGIGRCGAAAPLAAALCNAAGLEARVERVPGHVFAVAKASGVEVLVEADFFKKGVILREADGHLLRYATLLENPRLTDSQPDAGVWWTIHLRNTTDIWGRNSFGYLRDDFLLYSSYFDGAAKRRYKPKIPVVSAERSSAGVRMSWSDATPVDGAEVEYRVAARVASRGWNYHTEPDDIAPILSPPPAYRERWTDETSIEIDASEGSYFEVTPRLRARPDVFCWPSEEILLSTSTDQREW